MRSTHKPTSRREALTKYVRAKAHRDGILFAVALETVETTDNGRGGYIPNLRPRHPQSKWAWRGKLYSERLAKMAYLEQPASSAFDNIDDMASEVPVAPRRTDMTVPILEIARPAKSKGKGFAREFEVVRNVRQVIALPDDSEIQKTFLENDDDWERIYDEEEVDTRRSYSSVLRGNDRVR